MIELSVNRSVTNGHNTTARLAAIRFSSHRRRTTTEGEATNRNSVAAAKQ
jgi:hypothetical protein